MAVLFSAVGVWIGYPLADPMIGLVITVAILAIVWESGKPVFTRLLDGVDPDVINEITHALNHAQGVRDVTEIRLRWSGHRLHAEVKLGVDCILTVTEGHSIAVEARHQLLHKLPYLSNVTIHIDPEHLSGESHHSVSEHTHVGLPHHSIVSAARLIKRSSHSIFQRLSRRQRLSTNESLFCILQIDSTTAVGSTNFRRSKECLT